MKNLYSILLLLILLAPCRAQLFKNVYFDWEKPILNGNPSSFITTSDGGFLLLGDRKATYNKDLQIIKLSNKYTVQWEATFGGNLDEVPIKAFETSNGYTIFARTNSISGDINGNHGPSGTTDVWALQLSDNFGLLDTQFFYGTKYSEDIRDVVMTKDGGYMVVGSEQDTVTPNSTGGRDLWLLKLDGDLNKMWHKSYNLSYKDEGTAIVSFQSGYFIGGNISTSPGTGLLLTRIDENGDTIWTQTYGGSNVESFRKMMLTQDGHLMIAASSRSTDGDLTGNHGGEDVWVVKVDTTGMIVWQKNYGSTQNDQLRAIREIGTDMVLLIDTKENHDGNVAGSDIHKPHPAVTGGHTDSWVIRINDKGDIKWKFLYGLGNPDNFEPWDLHVIDDSTFLSLVNYKGHHLFRISECYLQSAFNYKVNNLTVDFSDLSIGSPLAWRWSFGDTTISTYRNTSHAYDRAGIYNVCLTVINGDKCVDTLCKKVMVGSAIGQNEYEEVITKFVISPNPFREQTVLTIIGDEIIPGEPLEISFYDILGNRVYSSVDFPASYGITSKAIKLTGVSPGIYLFRILKNNRILGQGRAAID